MKLLVFSASLKEFYAEDEHFAYIWDRCFNHQNMKDFLIQDGYLFNVNKLCVFRSSLKEHIIRELYGQGLGRHIGQDKTKALMEECYYWLQLNRDVQKIVQRCQYAKKARDMRKIQVYTWYYLF